MAIQTLTIHDVRDEARQVAAAVCALREKRVVVRPAVRNRIGDRDGWVCCICIEHVDRNHVWVPYGPEYARGANDRHPSVEHLVPVAAGGTNDESNMRIAHWGCNNRRANPPGTDRHRWDPVVATIRAAQLLRRLDALDPEAPVDEWDAYSLHWLVGFTVGSARRYVPDHPGVSEALRLYVKQKLKRPEGPYPWAAP